MTSKDILCFIIILFINCSNYLIRCTVIDESIHLSDNSCSAAKEGCSGDDSFIDAFYYLQRYGYISEEKTIDEITKSQFTDALMEFQGFMSIETTGVLDKSVIQVMRRERCSLPDNPQSDVFYHSEDIYRTKRDLGTNKWIPYDMSVPELPLNWWVEGQEAEAYGSLLEEAAQVWTDVADIKLRRLSSRNISRYNNIIFNVTEAEDKNTSSGINYSLNEVERETAFKVAADFTYNAFDVIIESSVPRDKITSSEWKPKVLYKLVHVWGHLLGLNHTTSETNSVMNPDFEGKTDYKLKPRDMSEILTFYGPSLKMNESKLDEQYVHKKRADWHNNDVNDLCEHSGIDSILEMPDQTWIVFRGLHYFEIGPNGMSLRSPRRIIWDFKHFRGSVDASFAWNDVLFLVHLNEYFKYKGSNNTFIERRNIPQGFPGIPDGPYDDIFVWNVNQKTYFFRGDQYWKYDSIKKGLASGYPKKISENWKGIPDKFDAAISSRHRNQTYFFKGPQFYRFDDISKKVVDDSNPPYPRKIDIWFFKCRRRANVPDTLTTTTPRPTPSYDFGVTETKVIDDNVYWEGILKTYLIVAVLLIIIVGGILAFYFLVYKRRGVYHLQEHEMAARPPQPPGEAPTGRRSNESSGPTAPKGPNESRGPTAKWYTNNSPTTSAQGSAAAPASDEGLEAKRSSDGDETQTTRL